MSPTRVRFGSLRRTEPISRTFDRGLSVDRHYIESFLARHAAEVRGRVLEVGNDFYTRRFGGASVTQSDVLNVMAGNPRTTIVADLASADHVGSDQFDCVVMTQTLQLIFDVRSAVAAVRRILKPGGVLLATFPGISQICDPTWRHYWHWGFTSTSARALFGSAFGAANVTVEAHGNALAAAAFLHNVAVEELSAADLDRRDSGCELLLTVRASKPDPA